MLIAASGMFTGCSNSEDVTDTGPSTPKTLELTIKGSAATKTSGDVTDGNEATVNNLVVGIFKSDGSVDNIKAFDSPSISSGTGSVKITYTAETPTIVVVANAPKADFNAAKTLTDFKAVAANLDNTTTATYNKDGAFTAVPGTASSVGAQNSKMLPMIGETSTVKNNAATVSISRIVSRISINSITADFSSNVTYNGYALKVNEIFLANAHNTVPFNLGTGSTTLYQGQMANTTSYLSYLGSGTLDAAAPYTTNNYFYVFPSTATDQLKLIIKATLSKTGASDVVCYYPIIVNKAQTGTTIAGENNETDGTVDANKTYTLSAVINNVGVSQPTDVITPTDVTLTVNVAGWAANLTQSVTF